MHKPNRIKMAQVISAAVPMTVIKRHPGGTRKAFYAALLNWEWHAFGMLLDWLRESQFTWEVETGVDGFSSAVLFCPPDDNDFLNEAVRDASYGEVATRLSCITGAIIAGHIK